MSTTPLDPYRLPTHARPSAYRLELEPDLDDATFRGSVEIDLTLSEPARELVLNSLDLELFPPSIHNDELLRGGEVSIDKEHERATITFDEELAPGNYTLALGFQGVLNDLLVGFYRSTYTDESGAEHTIATTQFESTDARRAFPCFDEPAFKATFAVTLVVPGGQAAYSNSPVVSEIELDDGRRRIEFAPTMKMSTYLVAFVVGPFEATEPVDVDGVPLRVVYTPGHERLCDFGLEVGAFALRYFKEYFGIPYPGEKVDLVAIPDFAYGAMENLGCVTFREQELLIDPASASQNELVRVAMVIAHELAHMWFGDLVTMAWWEGIWLNEAFATYMQYVCCDAFRPDWKMWVRFSAEREAGLMIDGLHSTRPIEFPVHSPADAAAMVDLITYQKGGSVLRMLEQYLGWDVFRDGIRHYLARHAYSNTVTKDLWASLEEVSGQPVGRIMDTWILQGGHPIVTVDAGRLSQRPFTFGPATGASAIGSTWAVPVLARSLGTDAAGRVLLEADGAAVPVDAPSLVNAEGAGVYRTSYERADLEAVATRMAALTEVERAVLIGDTLTLARAGARSIEDVLTLVSSLSTDVEPSVWDLAVETLDFCDRTVRDEDRPALAAATRTLLGPVFDSLGWEPRPGEDARANVLRATLVRGLGVIGQHESVRTEAAERFDAGALDGDLAGAIISVVASMRRPGDYDEMLRRFREAKDPQDEERYRQGVAAIPDVDLGVRTLRGVFDIFRAQDAPIVIVRLMANRVTGQRVWVEVTEDWDTILAKVPPLMQFGLGYGLAFQVSDAKFLERARAFHAEHPLPAGQQRIDQSLERLATSVAFAERERPRLGEVLARFSQRG